MQKTTEEEEDEESIEEAKNKVVGERKTRAQILWITN